MSFELGLHLIRKVFDIASGNPKMRNRNQMEQTFVFFPVWINQDLITRRKKRKEKRTKRRFKFIKYLLLVVSVLC